MKIVIVGNGLIGSQLATRLAQAGHDVAALGRGDGSTPPPGWGSIGLSRGPRSWSTSPTPVLGRRRRAGVLPRLETHLLAAEQAAGVGHHVILSIVGADRVPDSGYLRAKVAQERIVPRGRCRYSIVRSTQFFEFVPGIADAATIDDDVRATPGRLQPIASRDVVAHLANVVTGPALGATVEIAGPEALGIDDLVRRFVAATGDPRSVATDPVATYFGAELDDQLPFRPRERTPGSPRRRTTRGWPRPRSAARAEGEPAAAALDRALPGFYDPPSERALRRGRAERIVRCTSSWSSSVKPEYADGGSSGSPRSPRRPAASRATCGSNGPAARGPRTSTCWWRPSPTTAPGRT